MLKTSFDFTSKHNGDLPKQLLLSFLLRSGKNVVESDSSSVI